ncbi:MAG TPA: hypothetical protein VFH68_11120 [Polyangia bacterium]|nr:hypothetical protein [Polyangia bacterium]
MVQVELQGMHANDNGVGEERPTVRVPVGRPEQAYAHQGNLILPLRFARLMPGWQVARAGSGAAEAPTAPAQRRTAPGRRPPPAPLSRPARRRAPASR